MKGKPDWGKIHGIARRAEALKAAGELDYAAFRALCDEIEAASNGNPEHVDIVTCLAEREWIDRIYREEAEIKARKKKRHVA